MTLPLASAPLGRRGLLLLAAGVGVAGCGSRPSSGSSGTPSTPVLTSPSMSPSASASAGGSLPSRVDWQPGAGELVPEAKLAAVRRIEAAGNGSSHRLQVIDAQYGGLLSSSASVLVVCRTWTLANGLVTEGGVTNDVRLSLGSGGWVVTAINPSDPGAPSSSISAAATEVLANSRIVLPPAARADVASGQVHDSVLSTMVAMSRRWRLDVSVIRSGHPINVFGTDRPSDHPKGRAFDTWALDGVPVVAAGSPAPAVRSYMEALAEAGSYNVGGPILLGSAPQFFSDQTHHDHVHAGFTT